METARTKARIEKKVEIWFQYENIGKEIGAPKVELPEEGVQVLRIWNLMKGKIDWAALDDIAAYVNVKDIELTIDLLLIFQDQVEAIE